MITTVRGTHGLSKTNTEAGSFHKSLAGKPQGEGFHSGVRGGERKV